MLTTPSTTDVAGHLRLVVARTARRLRQEAGADLSPSMSSALAVIDRHGPLTPSELAAHERVQRPTITRVLARLEELGLVSRAPDPPDRRSSLVSARAEGRTLLRRQPGAPGRVWRGPVPADRLSSLITASAEGRTLLRRQRSRKDQSLAHRL